MASSDSLTVGFVPGVIPDKWVGRWRSRHPELPLSLFSVDVGSQVDILRNGRADMVFVRMPVEAADLAVIPLYTEQTVVVAAADHEISLFDEVDINDLDGPFLDPAQLGGEAAAVEVAASGAGMVILPMSIARLFHRRDAVHRPVSGVPQSKIGLAWIMSRDSELIEEFIGIVRGRTENSSRQPLSSRPTARQSAATAGGNTGKRNGRKRKGANTSKGKGRRGRP